LDLTYSRHAKHQMNRRTITEAEVEECLNDWDTQSTDKMGNSIYRARIVGGRGIKVVVSKDDTNYVITTADY
jgi:hypothetical protein